MFVTQKMLANTYLVLYKLSKCFSFCLSFFYNGSCRINMKDSGNFTVLSIVNKTSTPFFILYSCPRSAANLLSFSIW